MFRIKSVVSSDRTIASFKVGRLKVGYTLFCGQASLADKTLNHANIVTQNPVKQAARARSNYSFRSSDSDGGLQSTTVTCCNGDILLEATCRPREKPIILPLPVQHEYSSFPCPGMQCHS